MTKAIEPVPKISLEGYLSAIGTESSLDVETSFSLGARSVVFTLDIYDMPHKKLKDNQIISYMRR